MPEWQGRDIVPNEERYHRKHPQIRGHSIWDVAVKRYVLPAPVVRTLHSVEVFQDLVAELQTKNGGKLEELDRAALSTSRWRQTSFLTITA